MAGAALTAEHRRLKEERKGTAPWKRWGPYLSERQWGTVREDYSDGGDAWSYFTHDEARSRAYRWGEDGIAGVSRPVYGGIERFQTDPNWRDLVLFDEYFHGDNGAGLGASHQTGWTGLVAVLFMLGDLLEAGDGRAAPADRGAAAPAERLEHAG